jgi:hypothetical protein
MIISFNDLIVIVTYFLLAFFQFSALYILIGRYTKDKKTKVLAGTASPFIFILLGFPFKILGLLNFFAILQLILFLFLLFFMIQKSRNLVKNINVSWKNFLLYALLLIGSAYFLIFDSLKNLTYAFPDTLSSHSWIIAIITASVPGYQPGFAIHLAPLYFLINPEASLDFLGFAIGFVLLIYVVIILENLRKYLSVYFLAIFFLLFFLENQKFLIGFSSNQFFILYITLLFVLLYEINKQEKDQKIKFYILYATLLTIGITNPPLALYLAYLLGAYLFLLPIIFKFSLLKIIGLNSALYFGGLLYIINSSSTLTGLINFLGAINPTASAPTASAPRLPSALLDLIGEIIKLKFIESPMSSFFSFSGYIALVFFISVLIYSTSKRIFSYFAISLAGIIFGISTLTGIGQYSFIMGRVGWYYILVFIILLSIILQKLTKRFRVEKLSLYSIVGIFIFNLSNPPIHYRFDDEVINIKTFNLTRQFDNRVYLYSKLQNNHIFPLKNSNIIMLENLSLPIKKCQPDECYPIIVVIDKSPRLLDPVLSRDINREFINDLETLNKFYKVRADVVKDNLALENSLIAEGFKIYFDGPENSILIKQ